MRMSFREHNSTMTKYTCRAQTWTTKRNSEPSTVTISNSGHHISQCERKKYWNTNLCTHWCNYTSSSWHHKSCYHTQHYRLVCCSYWMSTQHHTRIPSDQIAQYRNHGYHIQWDTVFQIYKLNNNHDHGKETFSKLFSYIFNKLM